MTATTRPAAPSDADSRDTSRDGWKNRAETFLLTHGRPVWDALQSWEPTRAVVNATLIDRAVRKLPPRPNALSTMSPYSSWTSLTDRTFSGRHLPPSAADASRLPPVEELAALYEYRATGWRPSAKSTLLFSYFAQWFTDGFLRTDLDDRRRNTSNHEIDVSPLYGLHTAQTDLLRSREGGRLASQVVNGEEYPLYYFDGDDPAPGFEDLPIVRPPDGFPDDRRKALFAMGGDRANIHIGYTMMNVLFLREHNRVADALAADNPGWDDERLFETARSIITVIVIRIVVDEYINHIAPYHFKFRADPTRLARARWMRTNWMSVEFNLLYRWHSMTPAEIVYDGTSRPTVDTMFNTALITDRGLGVLFDEASRQPCGEIGLHNTWSFLIPRAEVPSLQMGRLTQLAGYNDYRTLAGFPRVTDVSQITGDADLADELRSLYRGVDDIDLVIGLFAEDVRTDAATPPLIGRLVGADAFSQALTNPLLSPSVFRPETFTRWGWELIQETSRLEQVVHRNIPAGQRPTVAMTRLDWYRGAP